MNKLRALQYFVAAAHESSFSGAARHMDVSVSAIAKLMDRLEHELGVSLFNRTVRGLTLTADGSRYLEVCQPILERLAAAEDALRGASVRSRGTLVLGADPILSQHCILPALPIFHERYPDIQIDVRSVSRPSSADASATEMMVLYGWPEEPGMIQRHLANTRLLICASPEYWETHGVPQKLKDLENHQCLLFRDSAGTVIDFWTHELNGINDAAAVSGWLISSHRDVILDAAIAGQGVARFTDFSIRVPLENGWLVPVLLDWESRQAPPISVLYRASQKHLPRVRLFLNFLIELFGNLSAGRDPNLVVKIEAERPHWYRRRHSRASATPLRDSLTPQPDKRP